MIGVRSEIGRLRAVVCHTPGPELAVVTPANRADYLFDDILDLQFAQREHRRFREILSRFATVHEISDLLGDVLRDPAARQYLFEQTGGDIGARSEGVEPDEMARLFIEGEVSTGGILAGLVNEAGYTLPPLPNLFFTRDAAAVIGDHVMIAAMKHEVRWSEEILAWTLFRAHPELANAGILFDGAHERRLNVRVEGGDVHVLRRDLLAVGMSERTTAAGIDALAREVFGATEITDIVVVLMPAHRAAIHLDMIFTMLDRELCCVFPPYFMGPTRLPVLHLRKGDEGAHEAASLFHALRDVDLPLHPIPCGGDRRTMQEREQWASGCNFFSVGPGQVLGYDRNEHTFQALREEGGFDVVRADELLAGDVDLDEEGRFVIGFEGSELVRGGGGPRCMTLPVLREEL
ncbi:MAG: arginine deiminase family protein [marine benthic group bacterium]|nr:arginine deiminase family protein [Candidatus Benthicola marisminoris]